MREDDRPVTYELGIEGGTLVTARGRRRANVYVSGGRVAAIGSRQEPATERIDAGGLLVMPGMVDTHVHLMDPSATDREDFPTGTAAAAIAGVTTILEHAHGGPVREPDELRRKADHLRDRSHVDFGLAAHAWPDRIDEVRALWEAGVAFFKVFTCTTHGVPGFDPGPLRALFTAVAAVDGVCLVHNEEATLVDRAEAELRATGRDDPAVIVEWRSREAELSALAVTSLLARATGVRAVMAHVSTPDGLETVARERDRGARLRIESCPQYLSLYEREILDEGAFRKFTPPARARSSADLDAMWRAADNGTIDHIATDHAPSTRDQKLAGSIWDVHFGLPGIDTTLPVLLDGAHHGRIAYERVVELYSEAPARAYGLYGPKGRLEEGADADLVLVDPDRAWAVRDEDIVSKAGWSPLAGRTLTGGAVATLLRGRLVARDRQLLSDPGAGRFVPGAGARRP
jgi:dihydroorotase (multifunctional complex type)